ncbi:MAG: hypothetical protein EXQ85_01400 [Alphaproteobacteria bacterium]|nr:hypothetical protein [Alphaproteobacteria bacterium]
MSMERAEGDRIRPSPRKRTPMPQPSERSPPPRVSLTERLAAEIADTPTGAVPDSALAALRRLVIDHVGITYMGAALTGRALLAYASDLAGRPDAVLLGGDGLKVPAEVAAGINGQFCRATNFEDTGPGRHIGPLCVHTALAVGQRSHASGREVLAAAALGYVHCARFHFAVRANNGMAHHRSTAAAIAARLLRLDRATTARALSLAWELPHRAVATGNAQVFASAFERKRISPLGTPGQLATPLFHARAGVQAAVMASHGLESIPDEIDRFAADYDVAELMRSPTPFDLCEHIELKPWPCNRPGQCALQALADLVRDHAFDAGAITSVRLSVPYPSTVPHQFEPEPETYWEAIYSVQWAAAMVLLGLPAGPQWVSAQRLVDPVARRLCQVTEVVEDRDATRAYNELRRADVRGTAEVVAGGRTYRAAATLGATFGSPERPMTDAMVEAKFHETTALCMPRERSARLLAALRRLDAIGNVNDLAALLSG